MHDALTVLNVYGNNCPVWQLLGYIIMERKKEKLYIRNLSKPKIENNQYYNILTLYILVYYKK